MNEPIAGVVPLGLEDIVCIDLNCCSMADIAGDRFQEKLAEFEVSIATGLRQLYAYVQGKPEKAHEAVMKHNRSVVDIKWEILKEQMLEGRTKTCLGCGRIFSSGFPPQTLCVFCGDGDE